MVAPVCACTRHNASPELLYDQASQAFLTGDLEQSQSRAERGFKQFGDSNAEWAWRFRILQARSALWRGLYEEVVRILDVSPPPPDQPDAVISRLMLMGVASTYLHDFSKAESTLSDAAGLCEKSDSKECGDVLQARGFLASEQKQSAAAEKYYELSLAFATSHNDAFLKSTSLLNLGAESLSQGRFDQAIDRSQSAHEAAAAIQAKAIDFVAVGNLGWAFYKLGDAEKAFTLSLDAEKIASQLHDVSNQENELTNIGYIYMDQGEFPLAEKSFQQALDVAQNIKAEEQVYNAQRVLARLALQQGDLSKADDYSEKALEIARKAHNHPDELYPLLVQGQVAARRSDTTKARGIFETVGHDPACPDFLKWEAQHSAARLDEDQKQLEPADNEYRAALATFEAARSTVRHEDYQLSFLTNAAHIYDDYIHFLVARGQPDEALRWADHSRARTLSEGLGIVSNGTGDHAAPPPLNPREISRKAKGVLLFYWLGEKQSYLWAITPQKASLFPLPPRADIESMVQRYRTALKGPADVLTSSEDGRALFRTLIDPAKSLLPKDAKVFIIPDGSLNNLNFETLIVAAPNPHFWIEDADVTNASSLRLLSASFKRKNARDAKPSGRLLLIGDSVAPSMEYPELPRAGQQMANVAKHFPAAQQQIYDRAHATPAAYLAGNPEKFSFIHFVAHGTASRLSPLDSAIVLSSSSPVSNAADPDSFKLYARDIVQSSAHHPLRADLVTISACYSAGERAYSGEGLVGLAWAFLRAGAHNVIAGLWDVTDASTEQLMDRFYAEIEKGSTPDAALRAAKLSLLHGSQFHNPFYWAPFQLYTGS
jgi:CHAT domain-containing protein/Tfp pilus assembly protein PilF